MDPEDLRELISAYQKSVAEIVGRFGGFVAKYMGDGVLVYFGYPQAHEHDAERSVRAGLELIEAVGGLKSNADVIQMLTSSQSASRQSRTTFMRPLGLSYLAKAYADIGHFEDASRFITEAVSAIETTGERWFEADADRIAGEIALKSPIPDASKAEVYFERSLNVARAQQAKSLELRAAMSMARLWRDQGKRDAARDLLAPVYGWFTEGFDTLDLKEAKALLEELAA
jgi:predicted ATPase